MPQDFCIEFTQFFRFVFRERIASYEGSNLVNEAIVRILVPLCIRQFQCQSDYEPSG